MIIMAEEIPSVLITFYFNINCSTKTTDTELTWTSIDIHSETHACILVSSVYTCYILQTVTVNYDITRVKLCGQCHQVVTELK